MGDPFQQKDRPDGSAQFLGRQKELVAWSAIAQFPSERGGTDFPGLDRHDHLHEFPPMPLNQFPGDGLTKEAIDVLVAHGLVGPVKRQIFPVSDARHQLYDSLKTLISDETVQAILMKSSALRPFFDTDRNKASSYLDPNIGVSPTKVRKVPWKSSQLAAPEGNRAVWQLPKSRPI